MDYLKIFNRFVQTYGRLPTETDPEYLEMLRMSKYRVLAVPDVSPGKCANCGASKNDGRKYIDFGLHVDWYGAVYLCGTCLQDVAREMGLFKELESQLVEVEIKSTVVEELREQGAQLHEKVVQTFKEFEEFYVDLHSHELDINTDTSSDSIINPSVETTSKSRVNPTESGINPVQSRAPKSNSSGRPKNIHSLADLLNNLPE